MSDLKQCDRCGAAYKPGSNTLLTVRRRVAFAKYEEDAYDLCEECYEQLMNFIGGLNED